MRCAWTRSLSSPGIALQCRSRANRGYVRDTQPEQAEQLRAEAEQAWRRVAELAPDSWVALCKRSDDLLRAEKWAESEAVARQLLESGTFSFERAQPLINVLFATGRINESIELQSQVMTLEPRAMFVSRDQQFNLYAAGRFEEVEAEYQRSRTLDGNHINPDLLAFTRGLARQDADPQALRELFEAYLIPGLAGLVGRFRRCHPEPPGNAGGSQKGFRDRRGRSISRTGGCTGRPGPRVEHAPDLSSLKCGARVRAHGICRGCWFTPARVRIRGSRS